MGEAKRRQKLDPHFGQNYPAGEENWVFTSASEHMAIGNLNDCLHMAGLTTTQHYKSTYIDPLLGDSLSEREKSNLMSALYLSRARVNDELYSYFFKKAVKEGEIYIDVNINRDERLNSEEIDELEELSIYEEIDLDEEEDEDEPFYNHIIYNPKRAQSFRENGF
ncbi:MAG: hypothetical protein QNJ55_28645 [Xenococcus sp. MO_188.B8]|nr:hypothetical protein [Xenococcus sp. MO_188.B8]